MTAIASLRAAALAAVSLLPTAAHAQRQAAAAPAPARSAPVANLRYEVTFDSASAAQRTAEGKRDVRRERTGSGPAVVSRLDARLVRDRQLRALPQRVHRDGGRQGPRLGQARLRHLADRPGRRALHHGALRLPSRDPRQRDGVEPARFRLLQRHQPLPLPRGPRLRLPGDGDGEDPARLADRDRDGVRAGARGRTAKRTITIWSTSRSSSAGSISTAWRWTGSGTGSRPIPPARCRARPVAALGSDRARWFRRWRRSSRRRPGGPTPPCWSSLRRSAAAARWSTPTPTSASTTRGFIGTPLLASITAHEIFHAWNVKRLRPADMWPTLRPARRRPPGSG